MLYFRIVTHSSRLPILNQDSCHPELACLIDMGRVRTRNEDKAFVDEEYGFAIVADGMGGHRSGEVASQMAIDLLTGRLRSKISRLRAGTLKQTPGQFSAQLLGETNAAIHAAAQDACHQGMGTTVALIVFHDRQATLAHVGDSRIYRLRDGRLQLLTRDDSLLCDQVELGLIAAENAADSHNRNMVTQALGIHDHISAHCQETELHIGDVFLLCTDGLSDLVEERDLELIVDQLKTNLPMAASHLVQLANDNGGYDNIALALARIRETPKPPIQAETAKTGWLQRLLGWFSSRTPE